MYAVPAAKNIPVGRHGVGKATVFETIQKQHINLGSILHKFCNICFQAKHLKGFPSKGPTRMAVIT